MDLLDQLTNPSPELIWGLVSRGIGASYFISFASLTGQVLPIAGRRGVTPARESFAAIGRHFPGVRRFAYFPSLLWLSDADGFLGALPWVGLILSASVVLGGPHVPWVFGALYLVYLTLDRPMVLVYPWDCLLFEAGFWAIFLPATQVLPDAHAVAAPLPALVWLYRLLVFRVMFGFGKHKFTGVTAQDAGFLKGFLVNQPLPTVPGWWAQKLPMVPLRAGLVVMFVVEILLPGFVFFPGKGSVIAAVSMVGLMVGIELAGNFGYFNVITCVVALSWFDTRTALALNAAVLAAPGLPALVNALVLLHTFGAVVSFPFNTFCAHTWMTWPMWGRLRPRLLAWPVLFVRALHPFRWLHAYGVFPPQTPPSVKIVPVIEATWDGQEWLPLEHRYSPTVETSPPRFCAPHHERFDQAVVYEAIGLNEASVMRNIVGRWDPYGYGGVSGPLMLLRKIVEGTAPGARFYDRALERARGRPLAARVRTYMLEPTAAVELAREGRYWKRTLIGPHFPPMRREDGYWDAPLPAPELWHPDDEVWLRRSYLGPLMTRAEAGESPDALVVAAGDGIDVPAVERFWNDFVPTVTAGPRHDWKGLRAAVDVARTRFGREELHRFERIAGRYAVFLAARLAHRVPSLAVGNGFGFKMPPAATPKTGFHARLLAYHALGEGRAAYEALFADPGFAPGAAERMTMCSASYVWALLRYEAMAYQCQKLRLMTAFTSHEGRTQPTETDLAKSKRIEAAIRGIVGSLDMVDFLKTQMLGPEDVLDVPEAYPRFVMHADGEVRPAD
jgi:hypothetical protein